MPETETTSFKPGTVLNDKWVVLEFIAKGGMGEIYRAHQLNLKRDVVIKVVSSEWLASCEDDEEELTNGLQRFRNEVQAMAQIRHPNIVQVYDYGSLAADKSRRNIPLEYIAMEYIPGSTLRATMSEEGFYPEEDEARRWLQRYFLPLLDGVEAMHRAGMIHRDLKPENVLMDGQTPKIVDFGLARSCRLKSVTQSIDVKGTPPYMSPEQFFDFGRVDQRADIYSLGKILYESIDGKMTNKVKPFNSIHLSNPSTPFFKALDDIIRKATAEDIEKRFETVAPLRQSLRHAIGQAEPNRSADPTPVDPGAHPPQPDRNARLKSTIRMGLAAAAVLGVLFFFWVRGHVPAQRPAETVVGPQGPIADRQPALPSRATKSPAGTTGSLPASIRAEDGMLLHIVRGGPLTFPRGWVSAGKKTTVHSFFMDETPVTNHQYVEFLNQLLLYIQVKGAVVRSGNRILLLLGEVMEGYEPILFKNGKFRLNSPKYAASPVLRVTAYGASAFARFYGRRLPTATEWLYAIQKGSPAPAAGPQTPQEQPKSATGMARMMANQADGKAISPSPLAKAELPKKNMSVLMLKANALGIRGLNSGLGEWGLRIIREGTEGGKERLEYVVLGAFDNSPRSPVKGPALVTRHPWEAFEEVGFRTVIGVGSGNG